MFAGFSEATIDFFIELSFNNSTSYFNEHKHLYEKHVKDPFYRLIEALVPTMLEIDQDIEIRPHRCLARIRRDTRFTKDKSPYKDHLWLLFKKANEIKRDSVAFWFEFSPQNIMWGMGFWGHNIKQLECFRRYLLDKPNSFLELIKSSELEKNGLVLAGDDYKRLKIPEQLPKELRPWYNKKEVYIKKANPDYNLAFTSDLAEVLKKDFILLKDIYARLRILADQAKQIL